ncbi:MAG: hypothetical protein HFE83_09510 [Lachnospiraceae bacterium]|nr:hypothetical protein [Lachnospiraceae bacterium]
MKITDLKVTPVADPSKEMESGSRMRIGPHVILEVMVELFTDEGVIGIGESPCFWGSDLCAEILKSARPTLVGKDRTNAGPVKANLCGYETGALDRHGGIRDKRHTGSGNRLD